MFYLDTANKFDCYGCRACEQICPTNCISMVEDEEGFNYPVKNETLCIHCDLCKKVCPNVNTNEIDNSTDCSFQPKAYLAIHKNEEVLDKSSSGGVFSAIVDSFCTDEFVVFGVKFDKDFNAVHTYTDTVKGTEKYRKSKYIQSDINESYKSAEKFLKDGKKVLFTGTPCQIAGLRLYLRKAYPNLFCADIVCHGVPSQKVFNKYKGYLEKKHKGVITSFSFRHKTNTPSIGWDSRNIIVEVNGKTIIENNTQDYYLKGYHKGLFYRRSCYSCKFANPDRVSDITMADFWGVKKLFPNENPHKGVSEVLINTDKGEGILKNMKNSMNLLEIDKNFVIEHTGQLNVPTSLHANRDKFFRFLGTMEFDELVERYLKEPLLLRFIRNMTSQILSRNTKYLIKKIVRGWL